MLENLKSYQARIGELLEGLGWSTLQIDEALMHVISKAAFPSSEHKTAQWINDNSAAAELFNRDPLSINRFHLYRSSMMLYRQKEGIEKFLSSRTNELFDIQDKIILYDMTSNILGIRPDVPGMEIITVAPCTGGMISASGSYPLYNGQDLRISWYT